MNKLKIGTSCSIVCLLIALFAGFTMYVDNIHIVSASEQGQWYTKQVFSKIDENDSNDRSYKTEIYVIANQKGQDVACMKVTDNFVNESASVSCAPFNNPK